MSTLIRSRLLHSPLVHGAGIRKAAAGLTTIVKQAEATSTAASVTAPADIEAGDLLVLLDTAFNKSGTPASVVPSNFTLISSQTINTARQIVSYKLATGDEASGSITGMDGTIADNKQLLVFRGDIPAAVLTVGGLSEQATANDPTVQTVTASGGTAPLVVLGCYGSNGTIDPRTMSPAKDGEISANNSNAYIAWKIYNSAPQNVSIDMQDEGASNLLQSFYIEMAA